MALGIAATYIWRGMGVLAGVRVNPESRLFRWVTCVSYAMLAGLISRMIVMPLGALQEIPLLDRASATVLAVLVFFLFGRNLNGGVLAGVLCFVIFAVLRATSWN